MYDLLITYFFGPMTSCFIDIFRRTSFTENLKKLK